MENKVNVREETKQILFKALKKALLEKDEFSASILLTRLRNAGYNVVNEEKILTDNSEEELLQ